MTGIFRVRKLMEYINDHSLDATTFPYFNKKVL